MKKIGLLTLFALPIICAFAQQNPSNSLVINNKATAFQYESGWNLVVNGNVIIRNLPVCPDSNDGITYIVTNKQGIKGIIDEKGKFIIDYKYAQISNTGSEVFVVTETSGETYALDRKTLQRVNEVEVDDEFFAKHYGVVSQAEMSRKAEENRREIERLKKEKEDAEAKRIEELGFRAVNEGGKVAMYFKGVREFHYKKIHIFTEDPFDRYWFFAVYEAVNGRDLLGVKVYDTETGAVESLLPIEYRVESGQLPGTWVFTKVGVGSMFVYRINGATEKIFELIE